MNTIKTVISTLSKLVESVQYWLSISIIACLTLLIFIQVILRYIFSTPIIWSHEIASGLLIWITFLGAGVLTRRGQHLRVDIVFNMFPEKMKFIVDRVFKILILIFSVFIIFYSYQLFNQQLNQLIGSLRVARAYYFSLPVLLFGVSIFIYMLESLLLNEMKKEDISIL